MGKKKERERKEMEREEKRKLIWQIGDFRGRVYGSISQLGPILPAGDTWQYPEILLLSQLGATTSIWWVEAWDSDQRPTVHKTAPPTAKTDLAPNVNNTKAKKLIYKRSSCYFCTLGVLLVYHLKAFLSKTLAKQIS